MAIREEDLNIDDYELIGMVFQKALVCHNVDQDQAETVMKFCQWVFSFKERAPKTYNRWVMSIKRAFTKNGFTEEESNKFIDEYISEAIFPSGVKNMCCVANNFTDITLYRKMVSVFYWNVVEPSLAKIAAKIGVNVNDIVVQASEQQQQKSS